MPAATPWLPSLSIRSGSRCVKKQLKKRLRVAIYTAEFIKFGVDWPLPFRFCGGPLQEAVPFLFSGPFFENKAELVIFPSKPTFSLRWNAEPTTRSNRGRNQCFSFKESLPIFRSPLVSVKGTKADC